MRLTSTRLLVSQFCLLLIKILAERYPVSQAPFWVWLLVGSQVLFVLWVAVLACFKAPITVTFPGHSNPPPPPLEPAKNA
ncbi:hypothetical protein AHMF7616_01875 [Adhaeribacter pallidiroseus]|uniref:Uncharacterized protein n=1 Tax=Adhaeribacter pallidiroseus TaxID=2072847 RepID=A0A369QEB9_9BACT|nr:hypothetical protein AHMF7616_01875 [Adhaeribacter pallidiroseus]